MTQINILQTIMIQTNKEKIVLNMMNEDTFWLYVYTYMNYNKK